jgi:hypothetical protein
MFHWNYDVYREERTAGFYLAVHPRNAWPNWFSISVCVTWPLIWLWHPGCSFSTGDQEACVTGIIGIAILTVGMRAPGCNATRRMQWPAQMGRGTAKYFPFVPKQGDH